jgi:hypothetical protein
MFNKMTLVALLALSLSSNAFAGGKAYSVDDTDGQSLAYDLGTNNLGNVVGLTYLNTKSGYYRDGALYDGRQWRKLAGPNDVGIPSPPGIITSTLFAFDANDINDAGQVVGGGAGGPGVIINPVISGKKGEKDWYLDEDGDGKNDLISPILIDGYNADDKGRATHITEDGTVFGSLYDARRPYTEGGDLNRLYRWSPQDGPQIIDAPFPYEAIIIDVNEAGEVIGRCYDSEWSRYNRLSRKMLGFYWSEKTGIVRIPFDLGGLSYLYDINENGEVVGKLWAYGESYSYAFRWKPATGEFSLLPGAASHGYTHASTINDQGIIGGAVLDEPVPPYDAIESYQAVTWDAQNDIRYLGNGEYAKCQLTDFNNNGYGVGYCQKENTSTKQMAWVPDAKSGVYTMQEIAIRKAVNGVFAQLLSGFNSQNQILVRAAKTSSTLKGDTDLMIYTFK